MQPKRTDAYRLNEASRKEMLKPHIEVEGSPIKCILGARLGLLEPLVDGVVFA